MPKYTITALLTYEIEAPFMERALDAPLPTPFSLEIIKAEKTEDDDA
jgi:hypothetical protein